MDLHLKARSKPLSMWRWRLPPRGRKDLHPLAHVLQGPASCLRQIPGRRHGDKVVKGSGQDTHIIWPKILDFSPSVGFPPQVPLCSFQLVLTVLESEAKSSVMLSVVSLHYHFFMVNAIMEQKERKIKIPLLPESLLLTIFIKVISRLYNWHDFISLKVNQILSESMTMDNYLMKPLAWSS